MNKEKNVWGFGCGLWALLLALWLAVVPLQAFAEEGSPEQPLSFGTAEVELYQCGGLPKEGLRSRAYESAELEAYLVEQLNKASSEIDVRDYHVDEASFQAFYRDVMNAHPELFFIQKKYSYQYNPNSNIVYTLYPTYKYTGDELRTRQSQFNAELNRIVNYVSSAGTTLGKLLRLNDYFCINYQYDETLSRFAPDELFIDKKGVCQAYMLGVRAVLNRLGIPGGAATSDAMDHTWNMVRVDGSWYHLDVTWNDPRPNKPLRVCHDNFLLSDSGIGRAGHYSWSAAQAATNTQYDNFFWQDVNTPMPMLGNDLYYAQLSADRQLVIRRWTIGGGTADVYSTHASNTTWGGHFPVQWVDKKLCYAVGDKLYLLDTATSTATLAYTHPEGHYIFSSYYANGEMRISAGNTYTSQKELTVALPLPVEIMLNAERLAVCAGEQATLEAMVLHAQDQPLQWESADPTIATVDSAGQITGVKVGVTEVTASCADATASCQVVVYQAAVAALPDEPLPQGYTFSLTIESEPDETSAEGWRIVSSDSTVVRVNADGTLTTLNGGEARLAIQSNRYPRIMMACTVSVVALPVLTLPDGLTCVEAEAFAGASCARVDAGAALERIGERAFADCAALRLVSLGASVTDIAVDAFEGCGEDVVFLCPADSAAAVYAQSRGWTWVDSNP